MNRYRWTARIGIAGTAFLALIALFAVTVRLFNLSILGVQPEAVALTAMMTAPFTIGAVVISTAIAAVTETLLRRNHPAIGQDYPARTRLIGKIV